MPVLHDIGGFALIEGYLGALGLARAVGGVARDSGLRLHQGSLVLYVTSGEWPVYPVTRATPSQVALLWTLVEELPPWE